MYTSKACTTAGPVAAENNDHPGTIFPPSLILCFFQDRESKVRGVTLRQAQHRKGLYHLMNETINPGILSEYLNIFLGATFSP